jgi:hypothetical protein
MSNDFANICSWTKSRTPEKRAISLGTEMEVLQECAFRPCFSGGKENYTTVSLAFILLLSHPYVVCCAFPQTLRQLSMENDLNILIGMYWMRWRSGICLVNMLGIDAAGEVGLLAHGKSHPLRTAMYMLELWKPLSRKGTP